MSVPVRRSLPRLFALVLFVSACASGPLVAERSPARPAAAPVGGGSPQAVVELRKIVEQQKAALAEAGEVESADELEDLRPRLQKVVDGYEALLTKHPDFAAGWAAYGLFLCHPAVEERRQAMALLLKANGLDPEVPVVKNQIGVLLAEDGRAIDALNYFLAASDLAPTEALYHFQIGLVLAEGRDQFLKSRAWTRATVDSSMISAFARAVALAPDRTDFAYRAAEAYYDLEVPRWDEAYVAWSALAARLSGPLESQTVRLHLARVRWKQGYAADARELLASVDEPRLAGQKALLEKEFAADESADTAPKAVSPAAPRGFVAPVISLPDASAANPGQTGK
ncbi:MAG: hypothetical protein MUE42_12450 [Opitutaceae bacterium]|jgi:tetratricopeptide (TPR) repeat protein|nr:hypothetical protein [Opitutaceae bacterium]